MKQPGFILILTLIMLSISTIVVTQIFFQGHLYNMFIPISIEKEKARQLALSGVSVALSQLSLNDSRFFKSEDDKKKSPQEEKAFRSKALLKMLLVVQGRWQDFVLTPEADGIDAHLSICITCEDGKLNLNKMYDFKKHEFVKIPQGSMQEFFVFLGNASKKYTKDRNMFDDVEEFLKKRETSFIDVTQLFQGKKLEDFKDYLFYSPVENPGFLHTESKVQKTPKIYLADLFTVDTLSVKINPWVLSPSLQLLFGINRRVVMNEKDFEKEIADMIEKVSLENISWQKDWDIYLKPLYKIDFQSIPKEIQPFLSTKFEPRLFSVLCYGKVGRVTQKLLAVLERNALAKGESIFVKKIFWL